VGFLELKWLIIEMRFGDCDEVENNHFPTLGSRVVWSFNLVGSRSSRARKVVEGSVDQKEFP